MALLEFCVGGRLRHLANLSSLSQRVVPSGCVLGAGRRKAHIGQRIKESVGEKRDRLMGQMKGTASRIDEGTPDTADLRQGAQQAAGVAQENPIGLAVGGVAAGFLAGMLPPSTRVEDERVGPIADGVKDQAAETGQEALERGKQVAEDAAQAAAESAKDVKETVKETGPQQADELRSSNSRRPDERRPRIMGAFARWRGRDSNPRPSGYEKPPERP
jgi:gas vesicle protein